MYIRLNKNFISTDMQCPGDSTCSNQGICDVSNGTCVCNPGYQGEMCQGKTLSSANIPTYVCAVKYKFCFYRHAMS